MASTSGIQKIHKTLTQMQKNLECSICLELLQDPVLTKCEHHFCNFCILALLQSKRRPSAPCPLCKEPITKRSLTTHSTLKGIVSAFQNVVAAIESDTGQKCTPPRGPLRFSQPEPPSQRPKRQEKKVEKKSNVRRGKAKSIPVIPIYLDDEEEDTLGQSSEQCPPLKNNLNVVSSFHSPRKTKKNGKKSKSCKGKENTQQSETEGDQGITGQSGILEVIANESLGQNETKESTNRTQNGRGGVLESRSANEVGLPSGVNSDKSPGKDPYEFIASQRTPRKLKKRKVKEKKKKPWEYSFGKISRKKKEGVGGDSERWVESQSDDDDYDDGSYVHREDIESEEERGEDGNVRDGESERTGMSGRKEGNSDGNKEEQGMNEEQIERIDSSDEDQLEETGSENGGEVETSVTEGVKKKSDISGGERRGRKGLRNAASKAMDAIKGQVISQNSGDGSVSAGGDSCQGNENADGIDVTEESYGRSLIDFGKVQKGKNKSLSIEMTEDHSGHDKTKQSDIPLPGSQLVNGHISQEFPISQPPKLNRNHGDKLFAKAYGRGKTRSPGGKEVAWPKKLEDDDDLPDVMNLDVDSDEEGKGNSQELFLEDVLEPTPPEEAGRRVRGDDDGDTSLEQERKEEAFNGRENVVEDVLNGMLEEDFEGQFDDVEEVEASDQAMSKRKDNKNGVEIPAENGSPQILNKGTSSFKEQRSELETREILEEKNAESGNKKMTSEEQVTDAGGVDDERENVAAGDEDEMVSRRRKKRESLKDKMRNKDGLTAGETENSVLNDPEEHLQSDWELALKLAQEFGSVPPDLDVRHSKRVNSKNEVKGTGRKGRKMRQLQIQNVPDVTDRGQHSRRGRSRRNLRSNVTEECDDVTIESFQDDSRGDASGKNQRKARQAKNERKEKGNVKNSLVDDEKESSPVQCVPETHHVGAKVTRGSLGNGKKKTVNERKIDSDADIGSEDEDGENKSAKAFTAFESREKVSSEVPKKQQKSKENSKENGCGEMCNVAADEGEVEDESTNEGGRRRSSRLSKSQEKINANRIKETEDGEKVDSDAGMKEEVMKEMTPEGKIREDGKGKRKSRRLSKSQEETKSGERKDSRRNNSEGDVKRKAEAEGVIVVDDGSDEEDVDGDIGQGKRMSARLLTKSQEKKMEENVVGGEFSGKGRGGGESQGRTKKSQTASALEEEKGEVEQNLLIDDEGVREESGQKRRSLRKKKEDGTTGDKDGQKTLSQCFDKSSESLVDKDGLKKSCVGTKDADAVPSQRKSRRGSNFTKETPQMNKTKRVESASSLKPTRATRQTQSSSGGTQAFSGSTTESIELDSNPTFAQPSGDVLTEKSPGNKTIGVGKTKRKRKDISEENLLLSGIEKVGDVAKEEGTVDRESHSFDGTRKSKRGRGEVKELDKNKKNPFNESKKQSSEFQEQKRLAQEKKREEQGGSLGLVGEESKTDGELEEGGANSSAGLGKSRLRSRSSGRKGKVISGVENLKDGSSSIQDEEEAMESVRRNTRRWKKDVIVKGQAEDETIISLRNEPNEEEACENVVIDQNKKEKTEVIQDEDEPKKEEHKPTKVANLGSVGETDDKSVAVVKDPTSPDIFTMHLEASEQDREGSTGRSNHDEEPRKETASCDEGDGGETPKTSKRKKKKRKTFSFGNEANLVNSSLIDDDTGNTVRGEAEKSSREVSKSGSTTDAGLELTEDEPQNKGDDSSLGQFVPATMGASESQGNLNDQIPIPRQLQRQKNEESQKSSGNRPKEQNEKCEKGDSFSEGVVSIRRISSLKNRGKRGVARRNEEDEEMSNKRFCSDSQFSLNSGEEESMVPPTPPVTASHCQTDLNGGSSNESECNSLKEDVTDGEIISKEDSLVQAFEKVKRCEEKASGSNQDDKIASSLSSPSISLFQDVEITGDRDVGKDSVEEVAELSIGGKTPGVIDESETGTRVPRKEVEGKKTSEKENESHGSSPEDLPNVLGEDATSGRGTQEDGVIPEMSKQSDADLNRDDQEDIEDKDKFVQPYNKNFDEEEPLFDDECPVSPASSIGRHNLTSASSVLSSQSDLMNSQQHDNAKRALENMEKEIAEMERALAEEEEMEAVSEKKDQVSDEDEEEAGEKERGEEEGKQQRRDDVLNTSQEAKCDQEKVDGAVEGVGSISFEGVDSIDLSSDEDEREVSKKQSEGDRGERRKTRDRRSSGYGKTGLKKYGKYENLSDIGDKDIAQNVKENLSEMAAAEKSLDSLLKAHAARRRENEKEEEEEEKEASGSGDEDEDRPSTPPAPSPSSSPPRSPSPAPLLSQRTLTRRLSPLQKNIQKAEEIVKSFSEERPASSQKRRRVVIEDSDSESEDEVQYRNKRKKSLKLDSPESYEADEEKVKGQPGGQKVESPSNVKSHIEKYRKEISPRTTVEKRDVKAVENLPKVSPKVGGVQHDSPERKKVTTPQTSSSGSGGSSSKKRPKKGEMMSLVATGLNKHKLKMVDQLCKKAGCKFSSVFIPSTTHVIVNTGENLTCERTLKYFQGIAARRWVISFQWVQDSLSASRLLPLEKYEIRGDTVNGQNHCGPRRARLWKGPPLLGDYNLFCLEPFTGLNKDQLESLLKACGGSVYQHPSKMPQEDGKENFIIAQHDVQEEETNYQALYEKFQVKVISREWVLDSIAVYTTQPITDYLLCDVTECDDAGDLMSDDEF